MKRFFIIFITIISVLILSVFSGIYLYKLNNKEENEEIVEIAQKENIINNSIIETNSNEVKVGPNTKLVLKKYYKDCKHTINSYVELPKELVNMTEEEIQNEYEDWSVEKFTEDEVILLKEEQGFCNEHYLLKEKDGFIAVYVIDKTGEEVLKELTGISTQYLPQNDLLNLESGIKVYGTEELNKTLEDYE